jgi:hypothetical protein
VRTQYLRIPIAAAILGVITREELALWLPADPIVHSQVMQDLVTSRDIAVVADGDSFTVVRAHNDIISRLEIGSSLPLLSAALA